MKVFLQSRIALLYPPTFEQRQQLEDVLKSQRIELRPVEEEALELPVAAVAGFALTPPPARPFEGQAPAKSCLVFSGLTEEKLNRALNRLKQEKIDIDHKAVVTNENRNWAFGTLLQEMEAEAAKPEDAEKAAE